MANEGIIALKVLYSFWSCAVGSILIVISVLFFVNFHINTVQFTLMIKNWQSRPFDDIQVISGNF